MSYAYPPPPPPTSTAASPATPSATATAARVPRKHAGNDDGDNNNDDGEKQQRQTAASATSPGHSVSPTGNKFFLPDDTRTNSDHNPPFSPHEQHQEQQQQPQIPDISSSTVPAPTSPPPSPLSEPVAWFAYPLSYAASSLYRRVSAPADPRLTGLLQAPGGSSSSSVLPRTGNDHHNDYNMLFSRSRSRQRSAQQDALTLSSAAAPPVPALPASSRKPSPFQPPPLTALTLTGFRAGTPDKERILSRALAEEIRLLVPPRLQLAAQWRLAYSVEQDGASLGTLYAKCAAAAAAASNDMRGGGFVLVVRDAVGGIFGAFLTDCPRPASSYYGTGECFLWSATVQTVEKMLAHLPPPPSGDTTHMESRSTTIRSPTKRTFEIDLLGPLGDEGGGGGGSAGARGAPARGRQGGASSRQAVVEEEDRIRFRAYPYSGVNDYMIYCESGYLSVGGGDGKYGLWLDDNLEQGISSPSLTFGNESLSEEGEKFEALGVEVWLVGG